MTTNNKDRRELTSPNLTKSRPARIGDHRVQAVRVLLEGQFHRKLGLREMGQAVRLSPWRLAHLFKSEIGMSPQRYLTLVRLQRAKDRLASGFLPVQEIAISVGIPNPSQFTKTFKAAYGMTPVEYRKAYLRIDVLGENVSSSLGDTREFARAGNGDSGRRSVGISEERI